MTQNRGWGSFLKTALVSSGLAVEVPDGTTAEPGSKPDMGAKPVPRVELRSPVIATVAAATASIDPGIYKQLEVDMFDPQVETSYEVLHKILVNLQFLPEDQRLKAAFAANPGLTPAGVLDGIEHHMKQLAASIDEFDGVAREQERDTASKEAQIPALRDQIARLSAQLQLLEATVKTDRQKMESTQANVKAAADALRQRLTSERESIARMKGA